jgi:amidohydrolase
MEHGKIFVRDGFMQASEDTFKITVRGSGAHGAEPHLGADPILAASHIMIALQSIVSRNADPLKELVVTVGKFHAGEADNVIPGEAVMEGTVRVFDPALRKLASERIRSISENVARAMGAAADVSIERGYDSLWNHAEAMDVVRMAARDALGEEAVVEIDPVMPVEDFAYYTQAVPGAFFFVGAKMADASLVFPHHHENFDFNEEAMLIAAKVFAAVYFEAQHMDADSSSFLVK